MPSLNKNFFFKKNLVTVTIHFHIYPLHNISAGKLLSNFVALTQKEPQIYQTSTKKKKHK